MASQALLVFDNAIQRCLELAHAGRGLEAMVPAKFAASECNRAVIVLSVSALDAYLHEVCAEAGAKMAAGIRPRTPAFLRMKVSFAAAEQGLAGLGHSWVSSEIREALGRDTLQRPEAIAKVLKLVDDRPDLWSRLGRRMRTDTTTLKYRLNAIVDRRNMIAHEADIDPAWGRARSLSAAEAEQAVTLVREIVKAVDEELF